MRRFPVVAMVRGFAALAVVMAMTAFFESRALGEAPTDVSPKWTDQDLAELRAAVLAAARQCPVCGTGNQRNEKYWVMRDHFVIREDVPDVLDAVRDIFSSKPADYEIFCTKLTELIILEGFIKFFETRRDRGLADGEAGLKWMRAVIEKNARDPSVDGPADSKFIETFVERLRSESPDGYEAKDFKLGDQIHFENPFFGRPENGEWRGVGAGTEGNNLFWDGDERRPVISPYHRTKSTIAQEKETITDWAKNRDNYLHSDFYKKDPKRHLPDPKWARIGQIKRAKLPTSFEVK